MTVLPLPLHNRTVTLDALRVMAITRSLFAPVPLKRAIDRLGFVQADPIRAPARAQDLILRHRVPGYRAGDLERRYRDLDVEEDFFINYGFVSREVHGLMHPRERRTIPAEPRTRRHKVLAFVRDRGEAHPRDVDAHFSHGTVVNYWGGSSNATTRLLDALHYGGLLRVIRRERGIRVYAVREASTPTDLSPRERLDRLVDVVVGIYAPIQLASLSFIVRQLRYGVPQLQKGIPAALARARARLASARVDGEDWFWPQEWTVARHGVPKEVDDRVRLLAPFDPVVWDRRRFERFWGWGYRFEAYTPVAKRKLGYYALPVLWRDRVVGWANLSLVDGRLCANLGYVAGRAPRDRDYKRAVDLELSAIETFLGARAGSADVAQEQA
jgi:uncharacterized protein YcaQ